VEGLVRSLSFWKEKRVFITGHTGFKGGWLSLWLQSLGAEVYGYALAPVADESLFSVLEIDRLIRQSWIGDLRDARSLESALRNSEPEVVIHMAAQPLVRQSYLDPVATFEVNVLGTCNLMAAVSKVSSVQVVLVVTTDKCYENREWIWPYRESDQLGGHDPYSASKACAELAASSFHRSFLKARGVRTSTARAGNVIGGGDWSHDRLIPDLWRSHEIGEPLRIRSPNSTRPWQHVLEPLAGYMILCSAMTDDQKDVQGAWNFGPDPADVQSVSWVADQFCKNVPGTSWVTGDAATLHEAGSLALDSSKARAGLGWSPIWSPEKAIQMTAEWFTKYRLGEDMVKISLGQIEAYSG
jgi:CDP-glucose 4,6-dehydratase